MFVASRAEHRFTGKILCCMPLGQPCIASTLLVGTSLMLNKVLHIKHVIERSLQFCIIRLSNLVIGNVTLFSVVVMN